MAISNRAQNGGIVNRYYPCDKELQLSLFLSDDVSISSRVFVIRKEGFIYFSDIRVHQASNF